MKPVSKTAYYCAGVRMLDAASDQPVIGDHYAKQLLGEEGLTFWEAFKHFSKPIASNRARHYIFETQLKQLLQEKPAATIILIGAGLDTRAFRLPSGRWVEIDEPGIISYKNNLLPANTCPNPLERISIDFANEPLSAKLEDFTGRKDVYFIIEGVLMYLGSNEKASLVHTLTGMFPQHEVWCDLMTKPFFEKFGRPIADKLASYGAPFTDMQDAPWNLFIDGGYRLERKVSTIKTALDLGIFPVPGFLMKLLHSKYFMGYAVYTFSFGKA